MGLKQYTTYDHQGAIKSDPLTLKLFNDTVKNIYYESLDRNVDRQLASEKFKRISKRKCLMPNLNHHIQLPITEVLYGDCCRVEDFTNSDGRRRFKGIVHADYM